MKTLLTLLLLIPSLSWGMDKNELKEELKYWKSLLDDELISQEDYDLKKKELLNISKSLSDEPFKLKYVNPQNVLNNTQEQADTSSNTVFKNLGSSTISSNNEKSDLNDKNYCNSLSKNKEIIFGLFMGGKTKKEVCEEVMTWSDYELCSKIDRIDDREGTRAIQDGKIRFYNQFTSIRGIACIDGVAYDKSDSSTTAIASQNKLKKEIEKLEEDINQLKNEKKTEYIYINKNKYINKVD